MQKPFLIIGGGLIGITTLYELSRRGHQVILFEQHTAPAQETSYANGGMLHPSLPAPWNNPQIGYDLGASLFRPSSAIRLDPLALPHLFSWGLRFLRHSTRPHHLFSTIANYHLAAYSTRETVKLIKNLKLPCDHSASGTLHIFGNQKALLRAHKLAQKLNEYGAVHELMSAQEVIKHEPQIEPMTSKLAGGIYFPDDHSGDARQFCRHLAHHAQKQGGEIYYNAPVKTLTSHSVELINGKHYQGQIILAAGMESPALAHRLGIHLPIKPAKGYSLTFSAPHLSDHLPHAPIVDNQQHIAITPLGDRLRVNGMAEFSNNGTYIDHRRIEKLRHFLFSSMPQYESLLAAAEETAWAGLRPMSADGRPFIGAAKNIWLNCGHGHLGWTKSMGSAKLLADLIEGKTPAIAPAPFAYETRQNYKARE